MSGIITPGQSKLVLHNRSEPYELTYNIAKSPGNNRRGIVLITESGSDQHSLFLTFPKLFMVFKILFRWEKTMTLKTWALMKMCSPGMASVNRETGLRLLGIKSQDFPTQNLGVPELHTLHPPSIYLPVPYHFPSKTKMLYELKLVSSGDMPSTGKPALWLESATLHVYFKTISTTE